MNNNTKTTPVSNREIQFECAELPVAKLKLSLEVQNFKEKSDRVTGVVEGQRLRGAYQRLGTAPIVVWHRLNGVYEVVTGRHRLDLAKQNGEETIPCHVVKEADGFTAKMARTFDAESNIRDGQGSLLDFVLYFLNEPSLRQADAEQRGLLSRPMGNKAWTIARSGSEDTLNALRNKVIEADEAFAIAEAAPNDVDMQLDGIYLATKEGLCAEELFNAITALQTIPNSTWQSVGGQQLDLFGTKNPRLRRAAILARIAREKRLELSRQLSVIERPVQRQKLASRGGLKVSSKAKRLVPELRANIENYRKFAQHPEIYKQLVATLAFTVTVTPKVVPKAPTVV